MALRIMLPLMVLRWRLILNVLRLLASCRCSRCIRGSKSADSMDGPALSRSGDNSSPDFVGVLGPAGQGQDGSAAVSNEVTIRTEQDYITASAE